MFSWLIESPSLLFSRASMLLFLTREAFWSFSSEVRLADEPLRSKVAFSAARKRLGDTDSRSFQKERGEFLASVGAGDASNGEESALKRGFCHCY